MRRVAASSVRRLKVLTSPLRPLFDYIDETTDLARLYWSGVSSLRGAQELTEALNALAPVFGNGEPLRDEAAAAELAAQARREVEQGFRRLNAHLLVGLFGVLDSAVDDWVCWWLENHPERLATDKKVVRVPPDALVGDSETRARSLYSALRQEQGASFRLGVSRFESAVEVVGLDGPVPQSVADGIYELQQVRNAYAHSGGKADRKFLESCPWSGLHEGEDIPVPPSSFCLYQTTVSAYLELLLLRGWATHGIRVEGASRAFWWDRTIRPTDDFSDSVLIQVPDSTPLRAVAAGTTEDPPCPA